MFKCITAITALALGTFFVSLGTFPASAQKVPTLPKVLDPELELQLLAASPEIVTPTAVAVDKDGRVYVIENHTHQRPANYKGPATDRILLLYPFDEATGRAKKISIIHQGFSNGMGLTFSTTGKLILVTRADVRELTLSDAKDTVKSSRTLVKLTTKGNYPHNGLAGPVFDKTGMLYFGMGENFGEPYVLEGNDGSQQTGSSEGGSMYRCNADGSELTRVATGFWNPFASAFDGAGQLFTVDNDPDARGPCRLLHVIPGADFGYKFGCRARCQWWRAR
jgi:putative membrane-bound dehydrogenase-like protein